MLIGLDVWLLCWFDLSVGRLVRLGWLACMALALAWACALAFASASAFAGHEPTHQATAPANQQILPNKI